jgi:hypothetical protein
LTATPGVGDAVAVGAAMDGKALPHPARASDRMDSQKTRFVLFILHLFPLFFLSLIVQLYHYCHIKMKKSFLGDETPKKTLKKIGPEY